MKFLCDILLLPAARWWGRRVPVVLQHLRGGENGPCPGAAPPGSIPTRHGKPGGEAWSTQLQCLHRHLRAPLLLHQPVLPIGNTKKYMKHFFNWIIAHSEKGPCMSWPLLSPFGSTAGFWTPGSPEEAVAGECCTDSHLPGWGFGDTPGWLGG